MENAQSPQLSSITGSASNYLHACLLELWREKEGREGIQFTPADLRKQPLNVRVTSYNENLDEDTSPTIEACLLQIVQVLFA